MNKVVLLTGAAGGVGIHILGDIMHNTDWEIVAIDSFRHKGYGARLEQTFSDHPDWRERVRVVTHDLTCPINQKMRDEIGPVNYILHLAALSDVSFSIDNPMYVIRNNVDSTLTMIDYARETSHDHFIYFSTDEVYGPVEEGGAHPEWSPHKPSNAYSASKAMGEDACYPFWRSGELKLTISNTMNNGGEMQSASKFPAMVQRMVQNEEEVVIHGTPDNIGSRFYIHSREVGRALRKILEIGPAIHQTGEIDEPHRYHIVGSARLNNLEFAKMIADSMGKELKYRFEDFHSHNPAHDIHYGLQNNRLEFTENIPFEQSLKSTIDWTKEHPQWQ